MDRFSFETDARRAGPPPEEESASRRVRRTLLVLVPVAAVLVAFLAAGYLRFESTHAVLDFAGKAPCSEPLDAGCLQPAEEVTRSYNNPAACPASGPRVCIVPVGGVGKEVIEDTRARLMQDYALDVHVLPPLALPEDAYNAGRKQFDAKLVMESMTQSYPRVCCEPRVMLIALTPADIYLPWHESWRFAFGQTETFRDGSVRAVVSTHRMDALDYLLVGPLRLFVIYGRDEDLAGTRARKMLTKYIGIAHYGLAASEDPASVLYNNILGLGDLDRMGDRLPLP